MCVYVTPRCTYFWIAYLHDDVSCFVEAKKGRICGLSQVEGEATAFRQS